MENFLNFAYVRVDGRNRPWSCKLDEDGRNFFDRLDISSGFTTFLFFIEMKEALTCIKINFSNFKHLLDHFKSAFIGISIRISGGTLQ